ncbi:hypothetical protein AOE01nite_26370 [Acetobacter oeni]|uniref:Uncharacterized protein n=1 Tax=Acetobacter oeni TaxID=304077 RepID=A0A511XN93_9PROT|nr:hypothetical protein AA21952_1985 [Acetobacter oeni LMG 21952]GEN64413.1 hypothetical protein AOE01nite_26370 [Acetobacter oeni]
MTARRKYCALLHTIAETEPDSRNLSQRMDATSVRFRRVSNADFVGLPDKGPGIQQQFREGVVGITK